jgi:hypothetical protein
MAYRKKKERHKNWKRMAKIVYPKPDKKGGFAEELVEKDKAEERIEELKEEIYG